MNLKPPIKVLKFGGASLASIELILAACQRIQKIKSQGYSVVVVASAMQSETDRLHQLANAITKNPQARELDALTTVGENVSTALLAIALKSYGVRARSFSAEQVRIVTNSNFGNADIKQIEIPSLIETIANDGVPIVAGFQGVTACGDKTSLGRGGSDTTAVAIAAALRVKQVIFYKDVDGVYSTDPKTTPHAVKLPQLSHNQMLELNQQGAKVLHEKAIELAKRHHITLEVRSAFNLNSGTQVLSNQGITATFITPHFQKGVQL